MVTCDVSHLLRTCVYWDHLNTVARKEGRFHSQRKYPIKYCGKKRWQTSFPFPLHSPTNALASHTRHQPEPRGNPPIKTVCSCHVKSFSNIRIDLLEFIVVTLETSHLLRSPLKAEADKRTVARKEGRFHSQSTQENKAEGTTLINTAARKDGKLRSQLTTITTSQQTKSTPLTLSHECLCISSSPPTRTPREHSNHNRIFTSR